MWLGKIPFRRAPSALFAFFLEPIRRIKNARPKRTFGFYADFGLKHPTCSPFCDPHPFGVTQILLGLCDPHPCVSYPNVASAFHLFPHFGVTQISPPGFCFFGLPHRRTAGVGAAITGPSSTLQPQRRRWRFDPRREVRSLYIKTRPVFAGLLKKYRLQPFEACCFFNPQSSWKPPFTRQCSGV